MPAISPMFEVADDFIRQTSNAVTGDSKDVQEINNSKQINCNFLNEQQRKQGLVWKLNDVTC